MFAAETIVAVLKSFDPGGAMLNLRLSVPVNKACCGRRSPVRQPIFTFSIIAYAVHANVVPE
jgi:hypothetical protein